jgi:hypothetical protein
VGEPSQLLIEEGKQLVEDGVVALLQLPEKSRDARPALVYPIVTSTPGR